MASVVQIANLALTKLGAARITDMADNTRNARVMNAIYEAKRDAELAAHPWTFAIKRAQIPALSTAPAFQWARQYPLPTDYLRLVQIGEDFTFYDSDSGPLFQVEGNAILTDAVSPLNVRYVYRVTSTGIFSPLFVEALACRMAAEGCEEITQNAAKQEGLWMQHRMAIREARRINAIEQPPQQPQDLSWVRAMTEG